MSGYGFSRCVLGRRTVGVERAARERTHTLTHTPPNPPPPPPPSLSSSGGLAPRASTSDAVAISVAPSAFDLDAEVGDLRDAVGKLKSMSNAIGEEAAVNGDLADGLADALEAARAAVSAGAKRLDRAFRRGKSWHMIYLMLFCVGVALVLYMAAKVRGVARWVAG